MKKELYTKPTSEIFELALEGNVLQTNSPGTPGGTDSYNNYDEDF